MTDLSTLSREDLLALVSKLQSAPARKLSMKVTDKGGVSLYGLGRFPVTLYGSQWDTLLAHADDLTAFLKTNRALLATKA